MRTFQINALIQVFNFWRFIHVSSCPENETMRLKVKVKGCMWGLSALQPVGRLYPCPQWVPLIHLQRRHAPHRHEKPLVAKEGTIQGILLAHTRFFYMPQSWDMGQILSLPLQRHAEDFSDAWKIRRLRPGLNSQTRVPEATEAV
jgi:hypothetical protein